jgi:hypothetical protein
VFTYIVTWPHRPLLCRYRLVTFFKPGGLLNVGARAVGIAPTSEFTLKDKILSDCRPLILFGRVPVSALLLRVTLPI